MSVAIQALKASIFMETAIGTNLKEISTMSMAGAP